MPAERGDVIAIVVREGMPVVARGSAVGLLLALGAGKLMTVSRARWDDLVILGGTLVLIALVGFIASCVSARRATRYDRGAATGVASSDEWPVARETGS